MRDHRIVEGDSERKQVAEPFPALEAGDGWVFVPHQVGGEAFRRCGFEPSFPASLACHTDIVVLFFARRHGALLVELFLQSALYVVRSGVSKLV